MASEEPLSWAGPAGDEILLQQWARDAADAMAAVIPRGSRVALVNFPNHNNAGDPAMWLGELRVLHDLDADIVYQASWSSADPVQIRKHLRDGILLLHGGGNIGDIYPWGQSATRERLLRELPDVPTVQLAQSIHFDDPANRDAFARLCAGHRNLTMLLREQPSLDIAQDHFDVASHLTPDIAFALGPLDRIREPDADILWLSRTDAESATGGRVDEFGTRQIDGLSVIRRDWLHAHPDEPRWSGADRLRLHLNRRLRQRFIDRGHASPLLGRLDATTYEPLARRWTDRGRWLLARGRVVITDRLHGHILSLLQGIPHVILDNNYGKLRSIHDGWTNECELTHWADDPDEALTIAGGLVTENRS